MDKVGHPPRNGGRLCRRSGLAAAAAAVTLVLTAAAVPHRAPAAATSHQGVTPAQAVANYPGTLYGVSAVSASDAWAAGMTGAARNMVLHWDGTRWTKAAIPDAGAGDVGAVSALSAGDAWAVGSYGAKGSADKDLAMHWNGTTWAKTPVPSPGKAPVLDALNSVSAQSPDNVWAVGGGTTRSAQVILHWNGTAWSRAPLRLPAGFKGGELLGVDALSRTDAWAVGDYYTSADVGKTLVLHWDGIRWAQVASPSVRSGNSLSSVTALSATDAWAVGTDGARQTLVLHWNGTRWSRVPSPSPGGTSAWAVNTLSGVSALSPTDAWAVGVYQHPSPTRHAKPKTLVLHWDGTRWTQVATPALPNSDLTGVAALSPTRAWAVGGEGGNRDLGNTLTLSWNGTSWRRT